MEDDVGGIAVHIAARVGALASEGEVLVSSTVKDLVAGSGIQFVDRGSEHPRESRTNGGCSRQSRNARGGGAPIPSTRLVGSVGDAGVHAPALRLAHRPFLLEV